MKPPFSSIPTPRSLRATPKGQTLELPLGCDQRIRKGHVPKRPKKDRDQALHVWCFRCFLHGTVFTPLAGGPGRSVCRLRAEALLTVLQSSVLKVKSSWQTCSTISSSPQGPDDGRGRDDATHATTPDRSSLTQIQSPGPLSAVYMKENSRSKSGQTDL